MFNVSAATEMITGVRVSLRAKKGGASTFTSTNAGKPAENATSAAAVARVACAVNSPRSNSTWMMGCAQSASATAAGTDSKSTNSMPRFRLCIAPLSSPAPTWRDSRGSSAVPTATPTTPSGSCTRRSA